MIKLALPKGRLQKATGALLERAGFGLSDYRQSSRSYRPRALKSPQLLVKVFQERDIAIQVAVGNYDLGICGLDWVQELLIKYPSDAVVEVGELGYGRRQLYVAASGFSGVTSIRELRARFDTLRLASEYPNLAESFALKLRLGRFRVFPVWGAAEVYPPENADVVIISGTSAAELQNHALVPLDTLLTAGACLIANRNSLEQKDLSSALSLLRYIDGEEEPAEPGPALSPKGPLPGDDMVSLALPDGHQQPHAMRFLAEAGLQVRDYQTPLRTRRPAMDGVAVKVIRPQDMPLQVANGNFDLAITGRDWLLEHLYRFPLSPVRELGDLGFGQVRIVAVVSDDFPAGNAQELRRLSRSGQLSDLRLASEYIDIADKYARDNHLAPYKVIPTWGATEAFLPEDADILIENTETGATLARHNLRVLDTLFQSSACLIGNGNTPRSALKREKMAHIVEALQGKGLGEI